MKLTAAPALTLNDYDGSELAVEQLKAPLQVTLLLPVGQPITLKRQRRWCCCCMRLQLTGIEKKIRDRELIRQEKVGKLKLRREKGLVSASARCYG